MASIQEPEVQFAQRLASNEKPIRSKAMKKLRKYINVRSQKATGGFTSDELLKLWKGLFYCLWMQDKPLLQEELSNLISSLIHSFHGIEAQFLYLESFLQTFKREWTGIDRLRMDKFFQLVRFMFRHTFELLKRKNWDSSVVGRFLELLTAQLLQSDSAAPSGLQFHILDLYMTELAALGSAELTADQNLRFIEPFCKTAAKTKDRTLFSAICGSIFSAIIDQAPYAIEDLMKELKAAEASDSGQASEEEEEEEEEDEDQLKVKTTSKLVGKKGTGKQINGRKSHEDDDEDEDEDEDDDEDEFLHLEDSDSELPCDDDVGPVLQFDYASLADKLFGLASRSSTPSHNRQRLYKIIKVLRDLSEGIFPQDEYPDEVSTDEDDEMFGSRKRMKRGGGHTEEDEEEGAPAAKKRKGKKKEASSLKQSNDSGKDDSEAADMISNDDDKKKKRKKRKKKKAGQAGGAAGEEKSEQSTEETEAGSQAEDLEKEGETHNSISSVKVTEAATPEGQSETLLLVEVKKQPAVTVTEPEMSPEADATAPGKKKKKKKGLKAELQTEGIEAESQVNAEAEITPETEATTPAKMKKKGLKAEKKMEETEAGSQVTDAEITSVGEEASQDTTAAPLKKKTKKKGMQDVKMDQNKEETDQTPEDTTLESSAAADQSAEKAGQTGGAAAEETSEQEQTAALTQSTEETEAGSQAQTQNSISSVKVTEAATPEGQSETLLLVEVKKQPAVTVTDEDQSETLSKKKKKRVTSELKPEAAGEQQTAVTQESGATAGTPEPEMSSEADATASGKKKKKKKGLKAEVQTDGIEAESQVNAEAEITPETEATTPAKRKKKGLKAEKKMEETEAGSQVTDAEITSVGEEASQDTTAVPLKKKTKKKGMQDVKMDQNKEETDQTPEDTTLESSAAADQSAATPLKKKRTKNQKESKTAAPVGEDEGAAAENPQVAEEEKLLYEITTTTPAKKKKKSQKPAAEAVGGVDEEPPLDEAEAVSSSGKPAKKKRKIPVTFEFEADELEAAASINGLAEEATDVEEPFTPLSTKKPQKKAKTSSGSDFVSFQSKSAVPTPLFCRTKGSPGTPLSGKKKSQTPKSELKKVTFGLKNNKTAEFRKTDRSLLVSPDGSSRVPFDPQQKPKFGVLKSPPTLRSTSVKNTPNRKKSLATPKSTPKRRPSAADFF